MNYYESIIVTEPDETILITSTNINCFINRYKKDAHSLSYRHHSSIDYTVLFI